MILIEAAVPEQREIPERVDARALIAEPRNRFEAIDRRDVLCEIPRGDVDFDAGGTHREVVGVDRGREQMVQRLVERDPSAPALHARGDLIVGALIVIDRSLEEQLGLALRRHAVERRNLMLRQHVGGGRLRQIVQADEPRDRLPGRTERSRTGGRHTEQKRGNCEHGGPTAACRHTSGAGKVDAARDRVKYGASRRVAEFERSPETTRGLRILDRDRAVKRSAGLLIQVHPDALHLRVVLERVHAHLAAEAALLVAAERRRGVVDVVGVDPDRAGLELARDVVRLLDVRVQTAAARPYCESLARAIASSTSANSIAASTGPKISSRAIVISGVTPSKTVGCRK